MSHRLKRLRFLAAGLAAAFALVACEPLEPNDDPLPPIEEDFDDPFDDTGEDGLEP